MFCPNCGSNVPDDAKFCAECGHARNGAPIEVAPEPKGEGAPRIVEDPEPSKVEAAAQTAVTPEPEPEASAGQGQEVSSQDATQGSPATAQPAEPSTQAAPAKPAETQSLDAGKTSDETPLDKAPDDAKQGKKPVDRKIVIIIAAVVAVVAIAAVVVVCAISCTPQDQEFVSTYTEDTGDDGSDEKSSKKKSSKDKSSKDTSSDRSSSSKSSSSKSSSSSASSSSSKSSSSSTSGMSQYLVGGLPGVQAAINLDGKQFVQLCKDQNLKWSTKNSLFFQDTNDKQYSTYATGTSLQPISESEYSSLPAIGESSKPMCYVMTLRETDLMSALKKNGVQGDPMATCDQGGGQALMVVNGTQNSELLLFARHLDNTAAGQITVMIFNSAMIEGGYLPDDLDGGQRYNNAEELFRAFVEKNSSAWHAAG